MEQAAVNTLVLALKSNNIWDSLTVIYPISPTSLAAAAYNLKDPTSYLITWVNNPTHSSTGVDFDGSTEYGKTGIIASTDLVDNDVHFSYYSRTDVSATDVEWGARQSNSQTFLMTLRYSGIFYFDCYNATGGRLSPANSSSLGLGVASRRTSTDFEVYMNGISLGSALTGGGSVTTLEIYLAAYNNNGVASDTSGKECAFASIGLGLTAAQVTSLGSIVQTYQENVIIGGREV